MSNVFISDTVVYAGVDDKTLDLFESQYQIPNGVSYNSYVILDEKTAVMDTVDKRGTENWLADVTKILGDRKPDYLIVSHMEPDHSGSLASFLRVYPETKIVGNAKTFPMIAQFLGEDIPEAQRITVKEGETLTLGAHTLQFFMAPMVHWPEVMVTYEQSEKILFSADGFGKFGALDADEPWDDEARRYYFNIVGKYGTPVQALLKKAAALDIRTICPLHGPILKEDLGHYIEKYMTWSSYKPEETGVTIACASIHGNTLAAAEKFRELLVQEGEKNAVLYDLCRTDLSEAVSSAFRYDRLVLFGASYDGGVFPCMEDFLHHLKAKTYQNRTVAYVQNGSWGPTALKAMKAVTAEMKNLTELETTVTIKSALNAASSEELEALAKEVVAAV